MHILILLIFLFAVPSWAQLDNRFFDDTIPTHKTTQEQLHLTIDLLPFHKNNEYFNPIVEGRTFFGYQAFPKLIWYTSQNVILEVGGFLQKDFGNPQWRTIEPFMRFSYRKNNFQFIFGNLEGALTHRLIEPLFNFERLFSHRTEQGLQLKWNSSRLFLDTWIDWEKMIYPNVTFQEEFVSGVNAALALLNTPTLKISSILQAINFHQGGQINLPAPPDTTTPPARNALNASLGIESSFIDSTALFSHIRWSLFKVLSAHTQKTRGKGWYATLLLSTRFGTWGASYWKGMHYATTLGGELFSSYSFVPENFLYYAPIREIVIVRYILPFKFNENACLQVRTEPYYDILQKKAEISWGIYVRFFINQKLYQKVL
ncbi:MAG: hypothetical protein NZM38_03220 [Cytophagales bacterium]|nr:hypothetical protein [Cytophagales bacterium]MDW8383764.1 hypothetical protein [Flammeovirgaceae bacterium]